VQLVDDPLMTGLGLIVSSNVIQLWGNNRILDGAVFLLYFLSLLRSARFISDRVLSVVV
jgi:hypothetical protein